MTQPTLYDFNGQLIRPVFLVDPATGIGYVAGGGGGGGSSTDTVFFVGSSTALAANATYTGATRDTGVAAGAACPYSYFNAQFYSDQNGTGYVDGSLDGVTWFPLTSGIALTGGIPLSVQVAVTCRYKRQRFLNGGTLQTAFSANCSFAGA